MKSSIYRWAAYLQIGLVVFSTGCHPTQPFFVGERGDLSHYLNRATQIEYPDLNVESLPEATECWDHLLEDKGELEFVDLTLEDCINYALLNAKLIPTLPGTTLQTNDLSATLLSSPSQQLRTVNDPAIVSTTANTQALVVDQNGNRPLPRGAVRSNQVGGVEDALAEFDAQYSTFLQYGTTDRQRNANNIFTPSFFRAHDTTYQSALSKRMANGTVATARAQTIYSSNNVPTSNGGTARVVPSDFTQVLELQVQHPLLRGRGTIVNRVPVVLARINEETAAGQFEEMVRNLTRDVENAYWELYCSFWALETAKLAHDSALKVYQVASNKAKEGIQESGQAYRAKQQVHQFEAQINAALNGFPQQDPGLKNRERELRVLLGWSASDGRFIRPSDRPNIAYLEFDRQEVKSEALVRSLEIRQQKWTVKQKELELMSAKNQILPDLNISGTYRWIGVGDELFGKNGQNLFPGSGANIGVNTTSAWESLFTGNFQEVALRAEFIPNAMGSRRAHSLIRNSGLSLAREHAVLQEKEVLLMHQLDKALQAIDSTYSHMQITLNQWEAAENDVRVQYDRYENPTQDISQLVSELLLAQERRARAQQTYYRAVCEYNKSIVQFHLLKGTLLDYNNIDLAEGPWTDKAYWDANERARERAAARHLNYGSSRPSVISRGELPKGGLGVGQGSIINRAPSSAGLEEVQSPNDKTPAEIVPAPKAMDKGNSGRAPAVEPIPDGQTNSVRVKSLPVSQRETMEFDSQSPTSKPQWTPKSSRGSVSSSGAQPSNGLRQASFDEVAPSTPAPSSVPTNRLRSN